ncbi:MAG: tripartite tricarboxylate transporter substrate binding protein [Negativicutes bacterium]
MLKRKYGVAVFVLVMVLVGSLIGGCGTKKAEAPKEQYPMKNITLIVPYPPGGSSDMTARPVAEQVSKILGKTMVVVNKAGAGGSVGAVEVAKGSPDGYNLVIASSGNMSIVPLTTPTGYTYKDFTPIAQLTDIPLVLAVDQNFPANTLEEFIQYAQKNKGKVRFSTPGTSSTQQVSTEILSNMKKMDLVHVSFNGAPASIAAVLGKNVEAVCVTATDILGMYKAKKLKVLAVYSNKRISLLPDVPCMQELGYKDFEYGIWYGIVGPKGMPEAAVKKLETAIAETVKMPSVNESWAKMGLISAYMDSKSLAAKIERLDGAFKVAISQIKESEAKK